MIWLKLVKLVVETADQKTLNDMSGFKPRGSFAGGQKTTFGGKGKKGGGGAAKRPGKRARDASKGRR